MKICVVIPTYNEEKTISNLLSRIKDQGLDILVVDDGSIDSTYKIAVACGVHLLKNPSNQGKGASLLKGFKYALDYHYDAVITMDGDGQHDPEDIANFVRLAKYSQQSAIIIGNRMGKTKNMPLIRVLTNRFMSWLISAVAGQNIPDTQCGFRLIKKEVLESVDLNTDKFETESEILIQAAKLGFKIESTPINTIYAGEASRINPLIDTVRFFRFIMGEIFKNGPGKAKKTDVG